MLPDKSAPVVRWRCPVCKFEVEVDPERHAGKQTCTGYQEGYGDADTAHLPTTMERVTEGEALAYEPLAARPGYNANPTDWVRYAAHLEAENKRLRDLYENAVGNRERFGWTINHLLECEDALRAAQAEHGGDFADFAEPFCAGWNAHRRHGDLDHDDGSAFTQVLMEAYRDSGPERARRVVDALNVAEPCATCKGRKVIVGKADGGGATDGEFSYDAPCPDCGSEAAGE